MDIDEIFYNQDLTDMKNHGNDLLKDSPGMMPDIDDIKDYLSGHGLTPGDDADDRPVFSYAQVYPVLIDMLCIGVEIGSQIANKGDN